MKMPVYSYIFSLFIMLLFVSCENENSSPADNESADLEDKQDYDVSDSSGSNSDEDIPDLDILKCGENSDCSENEVCDPYGDCVCDTDKRYFFKYDGGCINYFEADRLFCNGHAGMIDVNPEILKGRTAFIEKGGEDDVYCTTCLLGYTGKFCEEKLEGYDDTLQELDEENNTVNFKAEPYCKEDSECAEGLSCVEGYCECEGDVEFTDPEMAYLVSRHLGLSEVRSVFSGKELLKITSFQLILSDDSKNIDGLKCLSNIRTLAVPFSLNDFDMSEIKSLKRVQHLAVGSPFPEDKEWINEMDHLLSLDLHLWCVDFDLFKDSKSKNSLTSLELHIYKSSSCGNLDWSQINGFKNLSSFAVLVSSGCISEFDFSILSGFSHLKEIYIKTGSTDDVKTKVKNISVVNTFSDLTSFGIDSPEGYTLDDLNRNENLISLVIDDYPVSKKIADLFPSLIYLSYIDLGRKNDASVLSGLNRILKLNIGGNLYDLKYPGLENVLPEMEHLRTLLIEPFKGRSDLNFLKNMKYLERVQLFANTPDEKERDISVVKDLLYLWIFEDATGGSTTFQPFVENCSNGGSFCRQDANRYINEMKMDDDNNYRRIYFDSPLLDLESEVDNITFLKNQGITVEYDN